MSGSDAARRPRHDWRFLVPADCRGGDVVVAGDADACALLRESGIHGTVDDLDEGPPAGPRSLVVWLTGTSGELGRLDPFVGPETVLVVEHGRRTGPDVRAALRRWGLDHSLAYLVAPYHHDSRWYAPLDDARGIRWYLSQRFLTGDRASALVGLARGPLAYAPTRTLMRHLAPQVLTIAARRPIDRPVGVPDTVAVETTLLFSSAQDEQSRAVLAPFADEDAPAVVVKIAQRVSSNAASAAASERLRLLADGPAAALAARSVPGLVQEDRLGTLHRIVQASASGPSVERVLSDRRLPRADQDAILDEVIAWVDDLTSSDPRAALLVDEALTTAIGASLPPGVVQMAGAHLDLAPCNVVKDESGLTVIDWEPPTVGHGIDGSIVDAAPIGTDAAFFAAYWLFQVAEATTIDDEVRLMANLLDAVLDPATDRIAGPADPAVAAGRAVRRHLQTRGIDAATFPVVSALLWSQRIRARRSSIGPTPESTGELAERRFLELSLDRIR